MLKNIFEHEQANKYCVHLKRNLRQDQYRKVALGKIPVMLDLTIASDPDSKTF